MEAIINGKRYNTETADLIASDHYFDGSNFDRGGRNSYLYKTKRGNFFLHNTTMWQGEREKISPLSPEVAVRMYETLPEKEVKFEDAFGYCPEEA